jgi:hypothetical protein
MNEQRLKDLRNTFRPLREARAILGDELMSDEDDDECASRSNRKPRSCILTTAGRAVI